MQDYDTKSKFSGDTSSLNSTDDEPLLSLIDLISSRKHSLLDLVLLLEKYHTQGSDENRAKSISVLGKVINEVVNLNLDSKAVVGISNFFVAKLKDVRCILPSIKAIHSILKYHQD